MQNSVSGFWSQLMGRWGKSVVLAAAGAGMFAASVSAATVSYSADRPVSRTSWADTLVVPRFDGALGTLTKVTVSFSGQNFTRTSVESFASQANSVLSGAVVTLTLQTPGLGSLQIAPRVEFFNQFTEYDGLNDYAGTSGIMNPTLEASANGARVLVPGVDDVSSFVGLGDVTFSVNAAGSTILQGSAEGGTFRFLRVTEAGAGVVVTYEYDEPVQDEPVLGALGDRVWLDYNSDGVQDANEPGLKGWTVTLLQDDVVIGSQQTGDDGIYLFTDLPLGTYTVRVTPKSGYTQTFDLDGLLTAHVATAFLDLGETRLDVDFGYDCFSARIPTGTGCTPGFWSNRNGQALIRPSDLAVLTALKLVDNAGNDVDMMDPTTLNFGGSGPASLDEGKAVLRVLLRNSNAVNMAAQLSRHLAAFQLNVRWGFISGSRTFRLNGSTVTAQELIVLANATLNEASYTPSGHPLRSYQSAIKDILDAANNAARR